jgi:chemotaxis signal transduction protein
MKKLQTDEQVEPRSGAYLILKAGKRDLALNIRWIREILGLQSAKIFQMGRSAPIKKANIRGTEVYTIDLRASDGSNVINSQRTSLVVLHDRGKCADACIAMVADDVGSVQIVPEHSFHLRMNAGGVPHDWSFVSSVAQTAQGELLVIDGQQALGACRN